MLVSSRHKFVFLSNRKCASTSLVHTLAPHCGLTALDEHALRHTSYPEYREYVLPFLRAKLGDEVDGYDVFCLYREPAEWIHSWYRFRTREEISPQNAPGHWEYTGHLTWHDFMEQTFRRPRPEYARIDKQSDFVLDENGTTHGLTLVRYEDMNAFVDMMASRVGAQLDMLRWNVSPGHHSVVTDEDRDYCRERLPLDYNIYDSIKWLG